MAPVSLSTSESLPTFSDTKLTIAANNKKPAPNLNAVLNP